MKTKKTNSLKIVAAIVTVFSIGILTGYGLVSLFVNL